MRAPSYEKLSKKTLIDRLIEAERRLRTVGAEKRPRSAPAAGRRVGKKTISEERPDPAPVLKDAKRARSTRPDGADVKSASERDYTVLDRDGRIRRLYKVVKDIRDDAGKPVFSEGALYEINSQSPNGPDMDHPGVAGEPDQTELICRFRPNGALTFVNEAYCRYFGCDREDLRDRNILLSISEADREEVYSRLKDLRPERPVDTFEYRVVGVFGDILWNQWTYRALFDDSGNILEYQSVGRDITFRKYTQEILEKRAAILEAVTFAAEGFLKGSSWRDRIDRVLERLGAAMNASHVFLCENRIGQGRDIAVLRSYEWISPQVKGPGKRKKFLRNTGLAVRFSRWVYNKSEGRPIFGTIGQFPDGEVEDLALDKKLSIAVVPVLLGERWWGFIGFADYTGDIQWSEDEIAPLGAASEILGAAVEREDKERTLQETHATIRDQERFLAGVFDAIQDGIMVAAPDMTILRVNSTVEKRFPHAMPLAGRKCHEAFYSRKRPCKNCQSLKTLETGKASSGVHPIVGPDGECKGWVEVFSYPLFDHGTGRLRGVIEYSRDITEKKRAEEARRQSEELLNTFLNSSQDKIFLKDERRRYLFMNEAGLSFLGLTREEIVGKTDADIFSPGHADEIGQKDLAVLKKGAVPLLYEQRHRDRVLETTKFRVNLENGRTGIGGIIRDVTEQRLAEEARLQSEKRLRQFVDSSRDVIFLKDENLRYLVANAACLAFGGAREEDVVGKTDFELFPEDQARAFREGDQGALAGVGESVIHDIVFMDRFMEVTKFPVVLEGGRIGVGGIVRDVTEQRTAAEHIRRSEEMLRTFVDSSRDYIFLKDEKGRNILLNRAVRKYTGRAEKELIGKTDAELLPPAVAERSMRSDRKVLEAGTALFFHEEEKGRIFEVMKFPVRFADDRTGIGGIIRDITERKESEEALRASEARYRELADHLPVGIYEAGFDGMFTYANSTALKMYGYGEDDVRRGMHFLQVIAPEEHEIARVRSQSVRQGGVVSYVEYTFLRKDGSRFQGLLMARPLTRDGQVVGSTGVVTDITDLKQAQEALRKNEALLGSILKAAPIGVGMVHGRVFAWVNDGMTAMTGYAVEEINGKSARILYPDDGEFERAGREKYAEIAARGRGAVETRWRRKDGALIDVLLSSAPIDPANHAAGLVFTALDITAQKKAARILLFAKEDLEKQVAEQMRELDVANMLLKIELEEHRKTEEALVKSEQIYRAIVEDQTEIICRFRPDGTISFVNEAFCRYFGKVREEVVGSRYLPTIPHEDRRRLWTSYGALSPARPVFHMEFRIGMPDGAVRWLHWTNRAVYDSTGTLVEHQGVCRDITERIQSEQQIRESRNMLRSVFDGISDPLIMVREDMTLIMLNRAALRFFGALLYRDLIGSPCLEFFQGRYGEETTHLVQAVIAEQEPARYDLTTKGDSARYEEVFVYPVHAGGGIGSMAIIRITDRTKQRLMERELIQSEKLASLGLLISGIVHEINNPNNFISFNMPILRDYIQEILPVLDEHAARTPHYEVQGMPYAEFRADVMKLLENIEHGSTRINTTVAKLKEFSRKKEEKGARPIQPTGVVERAVAICHTQIRKTVKTFDVQVQQDMPEMVSDPDAIEQTLINLLINAAQAADKPDSHIQLKAWRGISGMEGLVLEVEDNGCGMDAKTASRIFDPFFTTKEEGLGTGLGLYISKNLLESVGGFITVESEIGTGTAFRVVIPDLKDPGHREKSSEQKGAGA